MVLISAHRCGAGERVELENTRVALDGALGSAVEYVEFDVQRCRDGTFVLFHDDSVEIDGKRIPLHTLTFDEFSRLGERFLRYDAVLEALAGRKKAHIDLKFVSPPELYEREAQSYEVQAAELALTRLGEGQFIVTSLEDRSVRAVRDWADGLAIQLLVGLSLGRDVSTESLAVRIRTRLSEIFPGGRYATSRANLVVAHHRLARLRLKRWAQRRGLPLLVWTVNSEPELQTWLGDRCVWMVTTDYPELATSRRNFLRGSGFQMT